MRLGKGTIPTEPFLYPLADKVRQVASMDRFSC